MFNMRGFILSHALERHPVKTEKTEYKLKYLSVLEYFIKKYSPSDNIAQGMFENYKTAFIGDANSLGVCEKNTKKMLKTIMAGKFDFKNFKLFTYRYCFLCDIFIMNAFDDDAKAKTMLCEINSFFNNRHQKRFDQLWSALYENNNNLNGFDLIGFQIDCWRKNKAFTDLPELRVLITANMSAGKSTLINALVGKGVNKTMNDACTAKIHYIYDKAFEDNYTHEWDYEYNLNADKKALMEDDERNTSDKVSVATYFNLLANKTSRLCIIDTPGVNSATNKEHSELTKKYLSFEQYDSLVYVVNAENAGTDDDYKYLSFIGDNVDKDKIIFVLNKLDNFKKTEDSIAESINNLKNDLVKLGFENPTICPVSSYTGLLAKKALNGEVLSNDEADDYSLLCKKFSKPMYDLTKFYNNLEVTNDMPEQNVLSKCGLFGLEQILLQRR